MILPRNLKRRREDEDEDGIEQKRFKAPMEKQRTLSDYGASLTS